jgi:hypothetical protein
MRRLEDKMLSDTQELAFTPLQLGFELKCRKNAGKDWVSARRVREM